MAAYADEHGFPAIGREAGGVLRALARMTGATRVFEFGSGYGYSATWFLRGMGPDGRVVCTEHDPEEVALGREFLAEAGLADRVTYHVGDALAAVDRAEYADASFDVVLVDLHKSQYPEAFARVRDRIPVGGVVVADNVLTGPYEPADVVEGLQATAADADGDGTAPAFEDENLRGIVEYLGRVRADDAFETMTLPVGQGLAISVRATDD
jgi:predicted O-methyltransferase YrrM